MNSIKNTMILMDSNKNKLNSKKKSWFFKPKPNAHIVCMLHQFLNKICVLCFVGIMERKDFERLPFFGDGNRS